MRLQLLSEADGALQRQFFVVFDERHDVEHAPPAGDLTAHPLVSLLAVAFAWTMNAAPAAAEHLVVPLSDPAKPAELEVSLVMGSIKVTGGMGREVVVEAQSRAEDEDDKRKGRDLPGDRAGMRRIPNTAIGLEAEEAGNKGCLLYTSPSPRD